MADFRVIQYTADGLLGLFAELAEARTSDVGNKLHCTYFPEYFDHLDAKTIVVEEDYVDRDYLEDFAGYYVRCFKPPKSRCSRMHFFMSEFSEAEFGEFLGGHEREKFLSEKLNDETYIGFIVIKPLPQTFVGRTCLRTYPDGNSGRHFPSLHSYDANLFGVKLTVKTLAYQEQDTEVARCATAALWSVLQGTASRFGHAVPTPVDITKNAVAIHGNRSRTLPAKDGLSIEQLADAIRKMQLEPYCIASTSQEILQAESYAYLRAGIPALLQIALVDTLNPDGEPLSTGKLIGFHAVALTGFRIGARSPRPIGQSGLLLRATRIDKFYAHDDQVGPFARMGLSDPDVPMKWLPPRSRIAIDSSYLESSWSGESGILGSVRAIPENLLIPLYPKMRIPFQDALEATGAFDTVIREFSRFGLLAFDESIEWDIYLATAAELKQDIIFDSLVKGGYGMKLLTESMPRFIWRSVGYYKGKPCVELLFDATDITQGTFFLRAVEYDEALLSPLRSLDTEPFDAPLESRSILEWFAKPPRP